MKYKARIILISSVVAILLICIVLHYFIMVAPTNELFDYAKCVMSGEIQPEKDDPLYRYSMEAYGSDAVSVKSTVHRKWVWHDEVFGYIHIRYSQRFYDENGKDTARSLSIDAIWIINKINGKWEVVEVIEHP